MRKINKPSNLLMNHTGRVYKIPQLIKMHMILLVIALINTLLKGKVNHVFQYKHKLFS